MSDEEEVYTEEEVEEEEEVEVEEEEEEVEKVETKHARNHSEQAEDDEGLTEAEKAMLAAKKRHEDDEKAKLESYEERRKKEREAEEEELRKLKEKQERRRLEREQEEIEMAEKKRIEEERRKEEEEARRARQAEEKRKKEEEKSKRQQMSGASFAAPGQGGRNFIIPTKTEKNDKFGNIVQAKQEMGMTKEQQEEAKKVFMVGIRHSIPESSAISPSDLKAKIKELHQRICKLETNKYDLEKRHERQEYDLKELNERSRQVARNATGGKKGEADGGGRFPPKVQVVSKYDRQIDRRNFKERRSVYENKNAFPCFPGVPPPPALFEKIFKKYEYELREEEDAAEAEEYED